VTIVLDFIKRPEIARLSSNQRSSSCCGS